MARGSSTPPPHDKPGGKGKIEGKPIGNQDPTKRGLGKTQKQHKRDK